jgi:hypothetical protein
MAAERVSSFPFRPPERERGQHPSRVFLNAVTQVHAPDSDRDRRAATINPDLLTAAERIQYKGYLCREDTNGAPLSACRRAG